MPSDSTDNPKRAERRPHVVLLNQAFWPDLVATAQMSRDLAEHLVRHGYRVSAVASRSVYGKAGASLPKRDTLEVPLDDGPNGEQVGHVAVYRVGFSLFGRTSIAARAADFAFFYMLAALKVLTMPRPDVVIGFTTPPFISLVGVVARWLRGSKAVLWLMDLYPDLAIESGVMKRDSLPGRFFGAVNRFSMRHADRVVVLGRCTTDRVAAMGVVTSGFVHIPVWADHASLEPLDHADNPVRRDAFGLRPEDVCVMYSGNFGLGHETKTVCAAMLALRDEPSIRFTFVGDGKRRPEIERCIEDNALQPTAAYHEYLPREQLRFGLNAGDIHLVSVRAGCEGVVIPSKLFGVMAAARPAVYIGAPHSEVARIIQETGCGVIVPEGDGEQLARVLRELAADPTRRQRLGQAGRDALRNAYSTGVLCERWRALLDELTRYNSAPAASPEPQA